MNATQPNKFGDVNLEIALDTYHEEHLLAVIEERPEVVQQRYWHGQNCLHKLVLRMDVQLKAIQAVIDGGVDINAGNNYEETPIMFAAKRGSLDIIKLLITNGADITLKDKGGRTLIHHAVMGGSIYLTHVLSTVYNLDIHAADNRGQTCLHITCSQKNIGMVQYLTRHNRTPELVKDQFENTALHYAASHADVQVLWLLVNQFGTSAVCVRNKQNLNVVQCCVGEDATRRMCRNMLMDAERAAGKGIRTMPQPYPIWIIYIFLPAVIFVCGALLSNVVQSFMGSYSGSLTMFGVIVYILYLFTTHSHRITHYSRWPNPMFAGAFGTGLIGTLLTWIVFISPVQYNTHQGVLFSMMIGAPITLYLYYKLIFEDPGFIILPTRETVESARMKAALVEDGAAKNFCTVCDVVVDSSTKHCRLCNRCVIHIDHHCLFLMKCVASNNHRDFVLLVTCCCIDILVFLYSMFFYFTDLYPGHDWANILDLVAKDSVFLLYLSLVNIASVIWGSNLVLWQMKLVARGMTYYQELKSEEKSAKSTPKKQVKTPLTNHDMFFNILYFLKGSKEPYKRINDVLHFEEV